MKIIQRHSTNLNERSTDIDTIIIHYTDMPTTEAAIEWLCNPESQVSAHYLIDENGQIYQLVPDEKRAWHAGFSSWNGDVNLNDRSIGIELANPGHSHGYVPFPNAQIESLVKHCKELQEKWAIPSSRILGHSDIAPQRKQDPGHLFPWKALADEGMGLWPEDLLEVLPSEKVTETLAKIGYDVSSLSHAVQAFQRHFRPHTLNGEADEETRRLLYGLLKAQNKLI